MNSRKDDKKNPRRQCAVISSESSRRLDLHEGDAVWVLFNGYAVVLQVD